MQTVAITTDGQAVTLTAPYNADLPPKARALGGRFSTGRKAWVFDARDEQRVRDLARAIYGTDGTDADEPGVTVRVDLAGVGGRYGAAERSISLAGVELVHRPGRDEAVRLARNVVLIAGKFRPYGGSMRNPALDALAGIVLEVRDMPRGAAEKAIAAHPEHVTLVDADAIDRTALAAERDRLTARIAEIDAILAANPTPEA